MPEYSLDPPPNKLLVDTIDVLIENFRDSGLDRTDVDTWYDRNDIYEEQGKCSENLHT